LTLPLFQAPEVLHPPEGAAVLLAPITSRGDGMGLMAEGISCRFC